MQIQNSAKYAFSPQQLFGFFMFYIGLFVIAFSLDYGNKNLFGLSSTVEAFYNAFVIAIVGTTAAFVIYALYLAFGYVYSASQIYKKKY